VNKLFEDLDVPSRAWSAQKLVQMGFAIREACEDVVISCEVHRIRPGAGESVQSATRARYVEEAARFLRCTRGMADCIWTLSWRNWLARRNRSLLQETPEGRAQLRRLDKALLLMDIRVDKSTGQVGADCLNELRLQELFACIDKPIVVLCPHREWCTMDFEQVRVA
jgi:hypothetical protein